MREKDSSSSDGKKDVWLTEGAEGADDPLCLCCGHTLPKEERAEECKREFAEYLDAIMTALFDDEWHDLTSLGSDPLLSELATHNLLAFLNFLFDNGFIEKQGGGLTSLKFKIGKEMLEFLIRIEQA